MTISTTKKLVRRSLPPPALLVALAGCGIGTRGDRHRDRSRRRRRRGLHALHGLRTPAASTTSRSTSSATRASRARVRRARRRVHRRRVDSTSDFAPNIQSLLDQNCTLIITVGFDLAVGRRSRPPRPTPTSSSSRSTTSSTTTSTARPTARTSSRSSSTPRRRRSSPATRRRRTPRPKKVGTFGGMHFPTVTIFMDGFKQGVEYWNEREGRHGRGPRLGRHQDGVFTGGFAAEPGRDQRRAGPRRPGRRRAPARRWPDLPERRIGHPRLRHVTSRCSVSTPTCSRPTRPSPTCCSPRSSRRSTSVSRRPSSPPATGDFDADAVRRHARERGRRPRPVPRLRVARSRPTCRASSTRSQAGIIDGSIPVKSYLAELDPATQTGRLGATGLPASVRSHRCARCIAHPLTRIWHHEARTPRNHQAVRQPRRERPHRSRRRARRDPLPPRRERRGQVDPDERPVRAVHGRRGRHPARRRTCRTSTAPATRCAPASAWCTSTSC